MIHIKIPATTANMGPGFDCIGMAFQLYNHIWIEESEHELIIEAADSPDAENTTPLNKQNLIYRTMRRFYDEIGQFKQMPGIRLKQENNIPFTRGLGSSAACIVGGILAANTLSGAGMGINELCELAAKIEGHPDNSTPALVGGIVVGAMHENKLDYLKLIPEKLHTLKFAVLIPGFSLPTEEARSVLPTSIPIGDAVFNISRAALMVAAFCNGDFDKLSIAMDDRLHQPYRMPLIPEMNDIFTYCKHLGAKAVFLSGAGPTLIAIFDESTSLSDLGEWLERRVNRWHLHDLKPDLHGATVLHHE